LDLHEHLVSYGIHGEEHRRFEFVGQYLESIVALDPQFCQTYRYADTFIIFQTVGAPSADDVRTAKRLLDQGLVNCPTDGQLWLSAGQFMAFIGTQFLTDEKEIEKLRATGPSAGARGRAGERESERAMASAGRRGESSPRKASAKRPSVFSSASTPITDDPGSKAGSRASTTLYGKKAPSTAGSAARPSSAKSGTRPAFRLPHRAARARASLRPGPLRRSGIPARVCAESWAAWADAQPVD